MNSFDIGKINGVKRIGRKVKTQTKRPPLDVAENLQRRANAQKAEALKHLRGDKSLDNLKVTGLSFCTFDKETLEKASIADIANRIKPSYNITQTIDVINDPRFGVMNPGEICSTCKNNLNACPGHLSRIGLYIPIVNPIYIRDAVKVLKSVCNTCCELIVTKDQITALGIDKLSGVSRLSVMEEIAKNNRCTHRRDDENVLKCKPNPVYDTGKIKETMKISVTYQDSTLKKKEKKETPTEMPIEKIIEIFDCISDETAELLGFSNGSHPRNFIMYSIPVIPPCDRPNVIRKGKVVPDPLTNKYVEIAKVNNQIKDVSEKIAKSVESGNEDVSILEEDLEKLTRTLYQKVLSLMEERGATQGNEKMKSDIRKLIKGKEGYMRSNIMGKRVDYCGRTVITPEPSLEFGQLRVPEYMAKILTFRMVVNSINRDEVIKLWNDEKIKTIIQKEGRNKNRALNYSDVKNEVIPQIGDIVDRFIKDGDYVLFNRQPSLHKYSFQAYQIVINKESTIGLHPSSTTPHNADFDGDESSIHVLQEIGANVEAARLASVTNCLISSHNFKPASGLVVDATTGSYILTQDDVWVSEYLFFDILSSLRNKTDLRTLETRFKKYNVVYSSDILRDEVIQAEEARLGRKVTKQEEDELIRKSFGILVPKLRKDLTKAMIEEIIPQELTNVPTLEEYFREKLNLLDFIRNEKTRNDLKDAFLQAASNGNLDIKRFDLTNELEDRIKKLYENILDSYKSDWVEGKIPSLRLVIQYLQSQSPDINIVEVSKLYYSTLYTKVPHTPKKYSGKALFSALFPATFSFRKGELLITEGVLRRGYISKDSVGVTQNSIIQAIAKDYGNSRAQDFITDGSFLAVKYITETGFSIGLKDCFPEDPQYKKFLRDKIIETTDKVKKLEIEKRNTNNIIEKDIIESKISATVNVGKSIGSYLITKQISKANPFYVMSKAGSKGSESNISQISGFISQQYHVGKRIEPKLTGGTRCLPYFKPGDIDPQAKGFCTSSYTGGLTPHELYFSQTASRDGTLDTNIQTKQSGKLRRTMAGAVANMVVQYDGTVRNSNGRIFQLAYGEDQFNAAELELFKNGKENIVLFINPFRLANRLNSAVWIE